MIKIKVWQSLVFSAILSILIILGAIYTSGVKGEITDNGSLTVVGKLGGGLLSVMILVWIWSLAIFYPTLRRWKDKSILLTIIFITMLFLPIVSFFIAIYYLVSKKEVKEKINVIKKKEVDHE